MKSDTQDLGYSGTDKITNLIFRVVVSFRLITLILQGLSSEKLVGFNAISIDEPYFILRRVEQL